MIIRNLNGVVITCPVCQAPDDTLPEDLILPEDFNGLLLFSDFSEKEIDNNFRNLIANAITFRRRTIAHLRFIADRLAWMELKCAGAKIGGSVTGIVSGILEVVGLGLSLSGFLAFVGVPLGITGAVVAGTGRLTAGITVIVENVLKRLNINKIEEDLQGDNFRGAQIRVFMGRAAEDDDFTRTWRINPPDAVAFIALVWGAVGVGFVGAGLRAAAAVGAGVARTAATTGLHIAGLVFATALIPIDLAQMIVSSIQIHRRQLSEIVEDMWTIADTLENRLGVFLIREHYFQLIHCRDEDNNSRWAYLAIFPAMTSKWGTNSVTKI